MNDNLEFMELFGLNEKPYCNLGLVWCRDNYTISFIEEGILYSAVLGGVVGEEGGIICVNNDLQQFMGMQPAVFSSNLEISSDEFAKRYEGELS